jgi:hypothetical protein
MWLQSAEVTFEETHDSRIGGCGEPVRAQQMRGKRIVMEPVKSGQIPKEVIVLAVKLVKTEARDRKLVKKLKSALADCLKALADCHETINGAIEMEVVEELTNDTMNAAHRGSYECIKKYSHLIN